MIFLDEIKEDGNHQSFSVYLVFYDMYICVPSYFIDENFTISFVELMPGRSRLHTNQKLVFVLQCGRETFFLLTPYFSSLISPFLFSLSCKKSKLSLQSKMPKNRILFFPENKSLTDADCLYMFHYNGELA